MYSTAQFKLDRTSVQHGLDTTCFSFHRRASMHVHARLMTSNLPCIALVYALDVSMMHACMQILSQGQLNKLYKHVYVLRCNPLVIQGKSFVTVKLK